MVSNNEVSKKSLFPISLVQKDLGYAEEFVDEILGKSPSTGVTKKLFEDAIEKGFADLNISRVPKVFG